MDDRKRQQASGKNSPPAGISPSTTELTQLRARVEKLEHLLQEHLAEKNQWHPTVRAWIGTPVSISLLTGTTVTGKLLWIDRYTLCVEDSGGVAVIHKAAIAIIREYAP